MPVPNASPEEGHAGGGRATVQLGDPQAGSYLEFRPDVGRSGARWAPRFGIGSLMLIMLVICVMAACTSYLVKAILHGAEFKVVFVSLTVAAPTMLLVVVSTIAWAVRSMPTRQNGR